jgi:Flp pilus assembly pilin Flp
MKSFQAIKALNLDESGQDLLEYALVLSTVLAAIVLGSNSLATVIGTALSTVTARVASLIS